VGGHRQQGQHGGRGAGADGAVERGGEGQGGRPGARPRRPPRPVCPPAPPGAPRSPHSVSCCTCLRVRLGTQHWCKLVVSRVPAGHNPQLRWTCQHQVISCYMWRMLPELVNCLCRASSGSQDSASSSSRASAPSNLRLPGAAIHGSQAARHHRWRMAHPACSSPASAGSAQPALRSAGYKSRRHCSTRMQNPSGSHLLVQTIPTAQPSQQQMCRRASTRHGCHRSNISTMHWLPAAA
jgi:hypothetical protein